MINNKTTDSSTVRRKTNFSILCLTFILVYTSYNAITNLQSSIHTDKTVGYYSLAIISGCSVLSCLFFTNLLIFVAGYKWTIVLAQVGFLLYIAANMYPKVWIIYPASVICGIFRAGFWTALSAYVTDLSAGGESGPIADAIINKYFGIFFSAFQTSQIWGNLVTYLVLRDSPKNLPINNGNSSESHCGAEYAENEQQGNGGLNIISGTTTYILHGVFMGLIVVSIILSIIMLDQKRKWEKATSIKDLLVDSRHFIVSTFKQMKSIKQLFLLPLAFWIGTSEAFLFGIFTSSFITCTTDLSYVGLIMIAYGVASSIFSVIVGILGKYNIRIPCYIVTALLCYSSYTVMLLWNPLSSQIYILFILVGMQGIASAIWDPVEAGE
ncbi:unnamed protein product [Adineta steineri]|uniref:UNC93-like protein n=1 Tax=Adineta steineri TaxID=433720 RepID=A0A813S231_9BILA|nr:unnamed protein product [Adineta steineri]CAF0824563.1 unnamed protein product [Adineta steineri]